MDQEQMTEERALQETKDGRQGLRLVVGAGLGYLVGKAVMDKPVLGALVGGVLALVIGSEAEEDA